MKQYTLREVAKHNKEDDLWLAIEGEVYDVTNYKNHPGGFDELFEEAGTDATKAFNDANHSKAAVKKLTAFWIGELAPEEPSFFSKHSTLIVTATVGIIGLGAFLLHRTKTG